MAFGLEGNTGFRKDMSAMNTDTLRKYQLILCYFLILCKVSAETIETESLEVTDTIDTLFSIEAINRQIRESEKRLTRLIRLNL